jgi:hypothetical protein
MKIILSRKGFDSGYGGCPSPILPDGRLISLPIPVEGERLSYGDLSFDKGMSYFDIMKTLTPAILVNGRREMMSSSTACHLDPDISSSVLKRKAGWKGLFGQIDAAQGHLANQGVSPGDLFLFFGWFRSTVMVNERLVFDRQDPIGRHVIFGYLQVAEIWNLTGTTTLPSWSRYHPHASPKRWENKSNVMYVARQSLSWCEAPGFGVFHFHPSTVLTAEGCTRSRWALPEFFKEVPISYHSPSSWSDGHFRSAAKGQEFVVDANREVARWAEGLIRRASR